MEERLRSSLLGQTMPKSISITATVHDGRISPEKSVWLRQQLALYEGAQVRISLSPPPRSSSANRYYWFVVNMLTEAMRDAGAMVSADDVHGWMKRRHLPATVSTMPDGTEIVRTASSAVLDSTDFHNYIEAIRHDEFVVSEMQLYIPTPEEYGLLNGVVRGYKIEEKAA